MSKNSLSFLTSYFLIIPAIAALPPPYQPNAPTLPISPLALMFYHVEALIKKARAQAKILREDAEREVIATDAVAVRPFGDADELEYSGEAGTDIGETQGGALNIRHSQKPDIRLQFC